MESAQDRAKKLDEIFHPRSIAVVGASNNPMSTGYLYMDYLLQAGYQGELYPINPKGGEIMGRQAYPSVKDVPGEVDYAVCAIAAKFVPDMLQQCGEKRVKAVHLFTGRLSETGDEKAAELEQHIGNEAKKQGVRLIGPNCPGLYYPKERIVTNYDVCLEPGHVGVIFQSGGMSWDFTRYADLRGVRFSKVVSYGNAVDLNECDLLEYFTYDDETKVIIMYIEGTRDGPRFLKALREAAGQKPVVVLKGGKSVAGTKRTVSHTSSVAGSFDSWETMFRQCNVVQAADFSDLLDLTVAFGFLPPLPGKRVGVVGGGGGISVLSADECEQAGLEVVDLPEDVRAFVANCEPYMADWMGNPVDFSITTGTKIVPHELLKAMTESPGFDFLICKVTEDLPFSVDNYVKWLKGELEIYVDVSKRNLKPIVVTVGHPLMGVEALDNRRWRTLFELRQTLIENKIPFFASNGIAATAACKVADYYQRKES